MRITVRYSSIDRYSNTRTFRTLAGARAFAVRGVGEHPEFGSHYAISGDGVGKVTVDGCTLQELFYGETKPAGAYEVWGCIVNEDRPGNCWGKLRAFATLEDASECARHFDEEGAFDGVKLIGTTDTAKAEIAAQNEAYRAQLWMDNEIANNPF